MAPVIAPVPRIPTAIALNAACCVARAAPKAALGTSPTMVETEPLGSLVPLVIERSPKSSCP